MLSTPPRLRIVSETVLLLCDAVCAEQALRDRAPRWRSVCGER